MWSGLFQHPSLVPSINIRVTSATCAFALWDRDLFTSPPFLVLICATFAFPLIQSSYLAFRSPLPSSLCSFTHFISVAPSLRSPATTLVNAPRGAPRAFSPPGSPRVRPYRRAPSPVTPPRRARDAAREPPLRPLRPFPGADFFPPARDAPPTRRPASPAPVAPGNYVLPTDLDENGDLLATVTSFPAQALKIMHNHWTQHLPMSALAPKALKEGNRHPHSDVTYAQSTADGRIAFVAPELDERAELTLTESEWRQAIPIYLRLVHYHCSRPQKDRIVRGLQAHFEWMMSQPDFYSDFLLYLRYDIAIRKFIATMQNYVPKAYEANIFMDLERPYVRELAKGVITSTDNVSQTRPRSRSPSPRRNGRPSSSRTSFQAPSRSPYRASNSRAKGFDSRGQSFRQSSASTFCIVCGHTGHAANACSTTGNTYLVLDKPTNRWLAPGGGQLCYRWNNNSQACRSCTREHRCTLCGDRGHNARACPRASS